MGQLTSTITSTRSAALLFQRIHHIPLTFQHPPCPNAGWMATVRSASLARACLQSSRPKYDTDEIYHSREAFIGFLVARGDAPERFDLAEEILDQVAPFVLLVVVFAVPQRPVAQRDDSLNPSFSQTLAQSMGVKRLVANEGLARNSGHKLVDGFDVMTLTRQQDETHHVSQSINQRRNLARQTTARAPDRLIECPPLAPEPC